MTKILNFEEAYFFGADDLRVSCELWSGGLSLTIPARQKLAICGRSGSGKSTLVMGIVRMAKRIQVKIENVTFSVSGISIKQYTKYFVSVTLKSSTLNSTPQ